MLTRRLALPAVVLLLALTACSTPAPAETPTPSLTLSDQALAYSAAEANWNEYVENLGMVDLSDQSTIDRFLKTLTGSFYDGAKSEYARFVRDHWKTSGEYRTWGFTPISWDATEGKVLASVCLDVSDVIFVDSEGNSTVSADRRDIQNPIIEFTIDEQTWVSKISEAFKNADPDTCG